MGMLPMGTANDQGRSFGVHSGVKALPTNIKVIKAGIEQWLDVGKVEAFADDSDGELTCRDLWFDSWGLGLSAQILAKRNREQKIVHRIPLVNRIYRDKLVYLRAGLSSWIKHTLKSLVGRARFAAEIRVDDQLLKLDASTTSSSRAPCCTAATGSSRPRASPTTASSRSSSSRTAPTGAPPRSARTSATR
jgi:diacylglycerol kinase family enzyme